nr:MAG TPA: hypothetical protein [Caudoviricetes sp.]
MWEQKNIPTKSTENKGSIYLSYRSLLHQSKLTISF